MLDALDKQSHFSVTDIRIAAGGIAGGSRLDVTIAEALPSL